MMAIHTDVTAPLRTPRAASSQNTNELISECQVQAKKFADVNTQTETESPSSLEKVKDFEKLCFATRVHSFVLRQLAETERASRLARNGVAASAPQENSTVSS